MELEHHDIKTNGITLHVVQAGPVEGSVIILLHGFPDFWYGWRKQISFLAEAGFRVWIPDQRGYNLSDKPRGLSAYTLDALADDIIGLMNTFNQEKVILIGHDWGGGVAWWLAIKYPNRLKKMIILNTPHGMVMLDHLRKNPFQLFKSWYIFFFQIPFLPEWIGKFKHFKPLVTLLQKSSRTGTFNKEDSELYRMAWSQPNALKSMVNWYRAALQKRPRLLTSMRVTVPTLLLWGAKDVALSRSLAKPSIQLCDEGRLIFFEEATHWLHLEEPDLINTIIADFCL